jgi:hypothetical protein
MPAVDNLRRRHVLDLRDLTRLRKLLENLEGDLIDEHSTYDEIQGCRETVYALLNEYENAPERDVETKSFSSWLARRKKGGVMDDFAKDWEGDPHRLEPTTLTQLIEYLQSRGAVTAALEVAGQAWRAYASWLRRHPS